MSSATSDGAASSPAPGGAAAGSAPVSRVGSHLAPATFWCYVCDMSVALVLSSPPLLCPLCGSDFLEQMDQPPPSPFHRHHSEHHNGYHLGADDLDSMDDLEDLVSVENFDEALHGLIRRTISSIHDDIGPPDPAISAAYDEEADRAFSSMLSSFSDDVDGAGPRPASRAAVEAIPTVQVTGAFLATDHSLLCAVCKDDFVVGSEGRRLPCGHIYHSGCILPWLSQHNSCPLCRFLLPSERRPDTDAVRNLLRTWQEDVYRGMRRIHSMQRSVLPEGMDELGEEDASLLDSGTILRRIARSGRLLSSRTSALEPSAASLRPGMGLEVFANEPDRVTSRSPLDAVSHITSVGGSGRGDDGRADEEGDLTMSEARARGLAIERLLLRR